MPEIKFNARTIPPLQAAAIGRNSLVEGNVPSRWWRKQSTDLQGSFMNEMRTSMRNGESVTQGITRVVGGTVDGVQVPGIMATSKRRAGALVSSSMNAVTNNARLATFQENSDVVKGTQQLSTLDNRTSDVCIAYSGQAWDITTMAPIPPATLPFNGGPPRHFNCRSTLVPVLKSLADLGFDSTAEFPTGTRASMDGQVPGDQTFKGFLEGKSETFQDQLLGPARARLWRAGKITLTDLVDMRSNPLTLDQLAEKVGLSATALSRAKNPDAT